MAQYAAAVNDPLTVKIWERRIARETEKETLLSRFIDKESNASLVNMKGETSKSSGDKVTCGLKTLLTGDGVTEGEDLEGNEESITTHDDSMFINELSHAVRSDDRITPQRVPFSVREEIRDALTRWYTQRMEVGFFNHICGYTPQTNTKYSGLNAITAPSSGRHLWASGSDDQSLTSSHKFDTVGFLEDMVTLARTASPMLKPIRVGGRDKYVLFLHDYQVRDMRKAKSTTEVTWFDIATSNLQAGDRDRSHIYDGAIGEYNDVVIHRSNYVTNGVNSSTGASIATVRRAVLCGAGAVTMAFGKGYSFDGWNWVEETYDYKRKFGVSAQTIYGLKKSVYNGEDYGTIVLSSYAAA